jgi:hypothetical protein
MDQSTQQNAAMVEEMAASAANMYAKAHELVKSVAIFRLADSRGSHSLGYAAPALLTH